MNGKKQSHEWKKLSVRSYEIFGRSDFAFLRFREGHITRKECTEEKTITKFLSKQLRKNQCEGCHGNIFQLGQGRNLCSRDWYIEKR